jgi:SHAQKYF class myb-like DNA-binding protein
MDAPSAPGRRMSWTPDLVRLFDEAVESLGGIDSATPTSIKHAMDADLTIGNIKSRLQKLRLVRRAATDAGVLADQALEISRQLDAELGKMHW